MVKTQKAVYLGPVRARAILSVFSYNLATVVQRVLIIGIMMDVTYMTDVAYVELLYIRDVRQTHNSGT